MSDRFFWIGRYERTKHAAVELENQYRACGFSDVSHEWIDNTFWYVTGLATLSQLQKFATNDLCREAK